MTVKVESVSGFEYKMISTLFYTERISRGSFIITYSNNRIDGKQSATVKVSGVRDFENSFWGDTARLARHISDKLKADGKLEISTYF